MLNIVMDKYKKYYDNWDNWDYNALKENNWYNNAWENNEYLGYFKKTRENIDNKTGWITEENTEWPTKENIYKLYADYEADYEETKIRKENIKKEKEEKQKARNKEIHKMISQILPDTFEDMKNLF